MELPVELVEDIVSFFYSVLHKRLSSGDHHALQVPNLGRFVIKPKSLQKKLEHTENKIPFLEKIDTMRAYEVRLERIQDLEKFKMLQEQMQAEKDRKQTVVELRKSKTYEEYNHSNLEEQGEDS
jgi:uncharacterized protein YktA (UPF0223 family)